MTVMFNLQMKKLRLRELKCLANANTANDCQSWDLRKRIPCFSGTYSLPNIQSHSEQVYAKIMALKHRSA